MERKLATVLFADLVDSTGLVTGSDPEVVRRRVQAFFDRVSHCVTTHGGIVEKFAGDAVMAAFGIPQAHEDDAERAVRAGLAILEAVGELELQARIGVESGEGVAEDGEATFATGEGGPPPAPPPPSAPACQPSGGWASSSSRRASASSRARSSPRTARPRSRRARRSRSRPASSRRRSPASF